VNCVERKSVAGCRRCANVGFARSAAAELRVIDLANALDVETQRCCCGYRREAMARQAPTGDFGVSRDYAAFFRSLRWMVGGGRGEHRRRFWLRGMGFLFEARARDARRQSMGSVRVEGGCNEEEQGGGGAREQTARP